MLILFRADAAPADEARAVARIREAGLEPTPVSGLGNRALAVHDHDGRIDSARIAALQGVEQIVPLSKPYRMVARSWRSDPTVIRLPGGLTIGGDELPIIAGPCSVENEDQILSTARAVRAAGAVGLRAGAYKPRSSPYAFQGLGAEGLRLLDLARRETGLFVVTEAMDDAGLDAVAEVADVIQIGARNMQNFSLLKRAGRAGKPVLLKRGPTASVTDWLLSAEYVMSEGNTNVILCERGIRGADATTRNVFDLNVIPALKQLSHLPVMADPSHGTGRRNLVRPMSRAAVAAGADGLLIEVHVRPDEALSDGAQSLYPEQFNLLVEEVRAVARALGRRVAATA